MITEKIILKSPSDGKIIFQMFCNTIEPGHRPYLEHHHTECEIAAVVSGSCEQVIRRVPVRCIAGDVMLFGSDEEHFATFIGEEGPLKLLILRFEPRFIWSPGNDLFDSRYLRIFLNHNRDFSNRLASGSPIARQISSLMGQIHQECLQEEAGYELIVKAQLMLILGLLGRHHADLIQNTAARYDLHLGQIENALNYIDIHLTEELTLEEIARSANMSRSYFSTVFKAVNGISVWNYITNKRIGLAAGYIREGNLSITQIALLCGFNTMANFNRSFKMVTHCTPSQYRKYLNQ